MPPSSVTSLGAVYTIGCLLVGREECSLVVGVCIRPSVQKMIPMAKVKLGEDFKCHRCGTVLLPIEDSHGECGHGTETSDPVVRKKKAERGAALGPERLFFKEMRCVTRVKMLAQIPGISIRMATLIVQQYPLFSDLIKAKIWQLQALKVKPSKTLGIDLATALKRTIQ